jgi:hypothetical protein
MPDSAFQRLDYHALILQTPVSKIFELVETWGTVGMFTNKQLALNKPFIKWMCKVNTKSVILLALMLIQLR